MRFSIVIEKSNGLEEGRILTEGCCSCWPPIVSVEMGRTVILPNETASRDGVDAGRAHNCHSMQVVFTEILGGAVVGS